jgi:predicted transporter
MNQHTPKHIRLTSMIMTRRAFSVALTVIVLFTNNCHALTEYIGDNTTIVAESVQPCHIVGDPDLYGLVVRLSFYVQSTAGLISVLFGLVEEAKAPRFGFNILYFTLLIILIRNTIRGSFALLEWYLVTGLLFLHPLTLLPSPIATFLGDEEYLPYDGDESHVNHQAVQQGGTESPDDPNTGIPSSSKLEILPPEDEKAARDAQMEIWVENLATENNRAILSDAVGIGFLFLFHSIFIFSQPWLYFTKSTSGHKSGCLVRIVFFGHINLYNSHWQGFLKFNAAVGPILGLIELILGMYIVLWGLVSWRIREKALVRLNSRRHRTLQILDLLDEELAAAKEIQESPSSPTEGVQSPGQIEALRVQLAMHIQEARGRREEAEAIAQHAESIIDLAQDEIESYKTKRKILFWGRWGSFVGFLFLGALSIWFLEETLKLNDIDLSNDIGSSAGQMLALIVAVLSTVGFLFEVLKKVLKDREQNEDLRALEYKVNSNAIEVQHSAKQAAKRWSDLEQWYKRREKQEGQQQTGGGSAQHIRLRSVWPLSLFISHPEHQEAEPAHTTGSVV